MSKFVYISFVIINLFSLSVFAEWQETNYKETTIYNYIPQKISEKKRALMLNLHGCRQGNDEMRDKGNWENTAEDWNMIVSVPEAPDGGVYLGCWDYFGEIQDMTRPDVNYLVSWIEKLLSDPEMNIDKNQIYISGFSSGASMAMVIGCIRPDLIAGLGIGSGPTIGTKYYQSKYVATDALTAANLCKDWAGDRVGYLDSQTSAIINGNNDIVVSTEYGPVSADFYGILTESSLSQTHLDITKLAGNYRQGSAHQWSDDWSVRVTHIINKRLGHNWPSGVGRSARGQVNGKSINFPAFLGEYLHNNNRRRK